MATTAGFGLSRIGTVMWVEGSELGAAEGVGLEARAVAAMVAMAVRGGWVTEAEAAVAADGTSGADSQSTVRGCTHPPHRYSTTTRMKVPRVRRPPSQDRIRWLHS